MVIEKIKNEATGLVKWLYSKGSQFHCNPQRLSGPRTGDQASEFVLNQRMKMGN